MNEFDKELEELSIWIEANRDVSPARWEDVVWPEIKTRIKQAIAKHVIGEDEEVTRIDRKVDDDVSKESCNNLRAEQRQILKGK